MLTGDSLVVAKEVAKEVGIEGSIIKVSELREIKNSSPQKVIQISEQSGGFARNLSRG